MGGGSTGPYNRTEQPQLFPPSANCKLYVLGWKHNTDNSAHLTVSQHGAGCSKPGAVPPGPKSGTLT